MNDKQKEPYKLWYHQLKYFRELELTKNKNVPKRKNKIQPEFLLPYHGFVKLNYDKKKEENRNKNNKELLSLLAVDWKLIKDDAIEKSKYAKVSNKYYKKPNEQENTDKHWWISNK